MSESVLIGILVAATAILVLQILLLRRKATVDTDPVRHMFESVERSYERAERLIREEMTANREETSAAWRQSREELAGALKGVGDTINRQLAALTQTNDQKLEKVRESVEVRLEGLQRTTEGKLQEIREENRQQLDRMRATVDEKLQGTLEKRLGESFRQVSERLEQVYRGLGEMQVLASGVGDLKRVLTNVKTRGTWGEVQLGAMLEQVLTPEQYDRNVAVKGGAERVEFAVKLPGRMDGGDDLVWLPIDAKFPQEDYQRLLEAQEKADADLAEAAGRQLENRIRQCAADISRKYLNPPKTTDFAILFLPTEGLFAEVIRRPALTDHLQRECRVAVAGPTTLWSVLNSLQMGFRTLAIEKRSSEVWKLLAAVKTEWTAYGEVLGRVQKKLHEVSETVEKAQVRNRAIGKKLKDVETLPGDEAKALLVPAGEDDRPAGTEDGQP